MIRVIIVDCEAHNHWDFATIFLCYGNQGFKEAYRVEGHDGSKMILSTEDLGFETDYDEELEELSEIMMNMQKGEVKQYEVLGKTVSLSKNCY